MTPAPASSLPPRARAAEAADIAAGGALIADPQQCRLLLALDDGRALPASRLAAEAGVSLATVRSHLSELTATGLLAVEVHGRIRYYRLADPPAGRLTQALHQLGPAGSAAPVRSLRRGTRSQALRAARTCYDHLAGRMGVELMAAMIGRGHLAGGDGAFDPARARRDRRTGWGRDLAYSLTPAGEQFLSGFGVRLPPRRPVVRYCVDWTEQRHHLAGALGNGLLDRLTALEWTRRTSTSRAVQVTEAGRAGLREIFGIRLDDRPGPAAPAGRA